MQDDPSQSLASSHGERRNPTNWVGLSVLVLLTLAYVAVAFDVFGVSQQQQHQQQEPDPTPLLLWLVILSPSLPALFDAARALLGWVRRWQVEKNSGSVHPLRVSVVFVGACLLTTLAAWYLTTRSDLFVGHDLIHLAPLFSLMATLGYVVIRLWQGDRPRGLAIGVVWILLFYLLIGLTSEKTAGAANDVASSDYCPISECETAPTDFPFRDSHIGAYPKAPFLGRSAMPESRSNQNNSCTIVLSMSGGGTNSASFAWGALSELNDSFTRNGRSIIREIDYIVTASGGGLAALALMEILREADLREDVLDQEGAQFYLRSTRFFSTLSLAYLPSTELAFLWNVLDGRASSRVRRNMDKAFVGLGDSKCTGAYSGPLRKVPKKSNEEFATYATCAMTSQLLFKDVFPNNPSDTKLPAFIPTVTAFETGHVVPILPQWMEKLGVKEIVFSLPHAASRKDVRRVDTKRMDYLDAVVLSMSFPGIGPVLGITGQLERPDSKPISRGIALADGGQSDNLGIGVGLRLGLAEAINHSTIQIVLDSSIQLSSPYLVRTYGSGEGLSKMMQNGVPLLGAARLQAELDAGRQAREVLGPPDSASALKSAKGFHLSVVSLSDVMDINQKTPSLFHSLPKDNCIRKLRRGLSLPRDRDDCELSPLEGSPQKRLGGFDSSLARRQAEVQLLIDAGREAMRQELASGLMASLNECLN
jgi:hypothetical protein